MLSCTNRYQVFFIAHQHKFELKDNSKCKWVQWRIQKRLIECVWSIYWILNLHIYSCEINLFFHYVAIMNFEGNQKPGKRHHLICSAVIDILALLAPCHAKHLRPVWTTCRWATFRIPIVCNVIMFTYTVKNIFPEV